MSEIVGSLLNDNEVSQTTSSKLGEYGEKIAAEYLKRKDFRLIASNFKVPVGRNRKGAQITGEIDIIAFDQATLCFIEVKTRSSNELYSPLSAINTRKQRQITRTAKVYRKFFNQQKTKFRYDAISVVMNGKKAPNVELVKGLWDESKFKKKVWINDLYSDI